MRKKAKAVRRKTPWVPQRVAHYVQTRSAYSPTLPIEFNQRRLELLKRITVPSLLAQTTKDWIWAVTLNADDPLLEERRKAYYSVGVPVVFAYWEDSMLENPRRRPELPFTHFRDSWNQSQGRKEAHQYLDDGRRIWEYVMPIGMMPLLMTRLDDDDALVSTTLARVAEKASLEPESNERIIWVFPEGFRYYRGKYIPFTHPSNMMMSVQTWPPDMFSAHTVEHNHAPRHGIRREVDRKPAWLWIRHDDAISGKAECVTPVNDTIRSFFPIDWEYLLDVTMMPVVETQPISEVEPVLETEPAPEEQPAPETEPVLVEVEPMLEIRPVPEKQPTPKKDWQTNISVVIPTIGPPRNLKRTLETLEDQTMPPDEIILVHDKKKRGAPWARNLGASYALGKYILFSDDDVEWEPYALKTMYGFLQSHHRAAFAWGSYRNLETKAVNCNTPFSVEEFYKRNLSSTMALIRRAKFPGFDENIERLQDWDLWLTMIEAGERGIYCGKLMFTTKSMRGVSGKGRGIDARTVLKQKHPKGKWNSLPV